MPELGHTGQALSLRSEKGSPTSSAFNSLNILAEPFPNLDQSAFEMPPDLALSPSKVSSKGDMSPSEGASEQRTKHLSREEQGLYDLKPPPPSVPPSNMELLADRLFSVDHLKVILKDELFATRFTAFLNTYRPHCTPVLVRYLETQKAIAAIEYGNAIASNICAVNSSYSPVSADSVTTALRSKAQRAVEELVGDALMGYITHRLVSFVTECLVKEITGNNTPLMRDMIEGLAEVYCMTDPSLPDNPIVYASEGITTQYGRDYVIGRNCRFLQGPKTSQAATARLIQAITDGQEVCETMLNYRRDGSPFLNLLMIAPLYDNKGAVRYFIGCQIDVSNLIVGGRALDCFQRLLTQDRTGNPWNEYGSRGPLAKLAELAQMLNQDEIDVVKRNSRASPRSGTATPARSGMERKLLGITSPREQSLWPDASYGSSGRLPGVYQNYLLVRPYPSLKITFTSPALRIPGLIQSRLTDRIGGPSYVREGLLEALEQGAGVTAKVTWLPTRAGEDDGGGEGKLRWLHCTPMLGSDDRVGVWMIVIVEHEEVTGTLNAASRRQTGASSAAERRNGFKHQKARASDEEDLGAGSAKYSEGRLYAEYLRREGRADGASSENSFPSVDRRKNGKRRPGRFVEDGLLNFEQD